MKRSLLLKRYNDYLTFRNYRPQTAKAYVSSLNKFIDYTILNSSPNSDVFEYCKSYLTFRFKDGKKWSSVNIDYSALKILVVHVLNKEWDFEMIPRPRGKVSVPTVLSGRQVESMINKTSNFKHKTIILLLYSTGLRISELIALDKSHLLLDRKQLKVQKGKGGKDRIVAIPSTTIKVLKDYLQLYKPKNILFKGFEHGSRYSSSSIRKIIDRAAKLSDVEWKVSAHSLRNAYATHHIENGTDLVTLKYQLGHHNIKTTLKYVKFCKTKSRHIHHPIQKLTIELNSKMISD